MWLRAHTVPHQRLFSASGFLLPSPEVSLTHSVFREMLPLSPHRSLNLPDQPVPSPPLQLFLTSFVRRDLPPKPNPTGGLGKDRKNPGDWQNKHRKGSPDQPERQPHPGVWNKHWQVFIYRHSASKYLCLFVTRAHTHIHAACQMPSSAANLGTLLSAKVGEESDPACKFCYKYARISSNLMSRCTRIFVFEYLNFHLNTLVHHTFVYPFIFMHSQIFTYICVCMHMYLAHMYICPPTFTYVWIHSAGNDNLDASTLIIHKSDVCSSEYVAHDAILICACAHMHLFSICLVMNMPAYRCA